jgi:hypothetical protein
MLAQLVSARFLCEKCWVVVPAGLGPVLLVYFSTAPNFLIRLKIPRSLGPPVHGEPEPVCVKAYLQPTYHLHNRVPKFRQHGRPANNFLPTDRPNWLESLPVFGFFSVIAEAITPELSVRLWIINRSNRSRSSGIKNAVSDFFPLVLRKHGPIRPRSFAGHVLLMRRGGRRCLFSAK